MKLSKIHIPFDEFISEGVLYQKIKVPKDFDFKFSVYKIDGLWVYYEANLLGQEWIEFCAVQDGFDSDLDLEYLDRFMITSGSLFILYKIIR